MCSLGEGRSVSVTFAARSSLVDRIEAERDALERDALERDSGLHVCRSVAIRKLLVDGLESVAFEQMLDEMPIESRAR